MTDCVPYDVSSETTRCESIELCCSDDSCWYSVSTVSQELYDTDLVLDLVCEWNTAYWSNPYGIGPWMD